MTSGVLICQLCGDQCSLYGCFEDNGQLVIDEGVGDAHPPPPPPEKRVKLSQAKFLTDSQLQNYNYHWNLHDEFDKANGKNKQSRLSFSLTVAQPVGGREQGEVPCCETCYLEMVKLEGLHQQLAQTRGLISEQLRRIKGLEKGAGLSKVPGLELALVGEALGKRNIGRTLKHLQGICNDIKEPMGKITGAAALKAPVPVPILPGNYSN